MHLHFGIPSLDELIQVPEQPRKTTNTSCATSVAVIGPDGTGKSVLALHLAAKYLAECVAYGQKLTDEKKAYTADEPAPLPFVLYISSDFRFDGAKKVWDSFGLGQPNSRQIPFERAPSALDRLGPDPVANDLQVELKHLIPTDEKEVPKDRKTVVDFLTCAQTDKDPNGCVGFIDLASYTTGDDWNFTNSILAKLGAFSRFWTRPENSTGNKDFIEPAPHLVIIDSVAGFETYTGDVDAYGVKQSRRARIAQAVRNAGLDAHLVFIVEEPKERGSLPEEYVTDIVLRLRAKHVNGVTVRTIEVEKARTRNHAAGEHPFEIRGQDGSSTGVWENPDTPRSKNAYVHVFKSLPQRMANIAAEYGKGKSEQVDRVSPFGILHLDELLHRRKKEDKAPLPWHGLRWGSTSGIIGEGSTGKSGLADKFIAEGFHSVLDDACALLRALELDGKAPQKSEEAKEAKDIVNRTCKAIAEPTYGTRTPKTAYPSKYSRAAIVKAIKTNWHSGEKGTALAAKDRFSKNPEIRLKRRRDIFRLRVEQPTKAQTDKAEKDGLPQTPKSKIHVLLPEFIDKSLEPNNFQLVREIFRHPNLRRPGVLLVTSDRSTEIVVKEFCLKFFKDLFIGPFDPAASEPDSISSMLFKIIEEQLIVRRFDAARISAPELFHLIQHNIVEAQRMIFGLCFPPSHSLRAKRSGCIRLVLDDLKVLAHLCPAIIEDSSFLPFLAFHLEREGVTTLLVHTESMRPFKRPDDPLARQIQPLLRHTILTWGVAFQGRSRIAISVVPPDGKENSGLVRELEVVSPTPENPSGYIYPRVSRHFELFSGIEKDDPKLVPLEINIVAATEGVRRYIEQEEVMFRTQFQPLPKPRSGQPDRVIVPVDAAKYYAIRDVTHLPWDVKAHYSIVDQVESYWSLDAASGSLSSQRNYLMARKPEGNEDTFCLFQKRGLSKGPRFANGIDKREIPAEKQHQRRYFFQNSGYRSRIYDFADDNPALTPDRVPFTWDFAFLLIPVAAWETVANKTPQGDGPECDEVKKVQKVFRDLQRTFSDRPYISWREFFGACKTVANVNRRQRSDRPVPFDFAATSAETLASLFLEIWLSEYHWEVTRVDNENKEEKGVWGKWLQRISCHVYKPLEKKKESDENKETPQLFSLSKLFESDTPVGGHFAALKKHYEVALEKATKKQNGKLLSTKELHDCLDKEDKSRGREHFKEMNRAALALFKTWLLLLEVLDFEAILDPANPFEMRQPKEPSPHAIATRHFYRTACELQAKQAKEKDTVLEGHYVLAMPGLFSTRGDTFLASPEASRSRLMASYAIDILSSRRANLSRMQLGVGLPVRDLLQDSACLKMRTALRARVPDPASPNDSERPLLGQVTYEELCKLGAQNHIFGENGSDPNMLDDERNWRSRWLYRNGLPEYDRISRVLQRWIVRLFRWTVAYRDEHPLNWQGGLEAYDALCERQFAKVYEYESFVYFGELVDYLVDELKAAERASPEDGEQDKRRKMSEPF